jgi:hypothetical protein
MEMNRKFNPPEPSICHPEQRELETPDNWPHSVPMVTERIEDFYFGHMVLAEFTTLHGVLYSVWGKPFKNHGDAIDWCKANAEVPPPVEHQDRVIEYASGDRQHLARNILWKKPVPASATAPPVAQPLAAVESSAPPVGPPSQTATEPEPTTASP